MPKRTADVVIIGAGSAGLAAFSTASKSRNEVLLVDPGPLGTKCARDGCMPSKLLIAAACAAHDARRAEMFGVRTEVSVDGERVFERLREQRDRFVASVVDSIPRDRYVEASARFVDERTIELSDGGRIEAEGFVVATGTKASIPPPLREIDVLTHRNVFELKTLPRSLAVVGAGPIGLELGQAFARLGVEVRLYEMASKLEIISDPEVRPSLQAALQEDLRLELGVELQSAEETKDGVRLSLEGAEDWTAERVFVAAGTSPNTSSLDLEKAGVALDEGRPCFDPATLRCGETRVFVAGDVTGSRPVLHEAVAEGRHAGGNAGKCDEPLAFVRHTPLHIVFTDPQIARIGTSFEDLDQETIRIGAVDFSDQGRSKVHGVNAGTLRVYADQKTSLVVGAELVAPRGEHLAHLLAWVVERRLPLDDILGLPFYHPCFEEGLRTALREAWRNCSLTRDIGDAPYDCGVGS